MASNGKRKKILQACVYCKRSHMTCDEVRPCGRCVKRRIGHLCHDSHHKVSKGANEASPLALGAYQKTIHQLTDIYAENSTGDAEVVPYDYDASVGRLRMFIREK